MITFKIYTNHETLNLAWVQNTPTPLLYFTQKYLKYYDTHINF